MQIVIDIPEEAYNWLKIIGPDWYGARYVLDAVSNGTLLPKGHGDLIDRNDLLEYTDISKCAYTPAITRYDIITMPIIIEADKEE